MKNKENKGKRIILIGIFLLLIIGFFNTAAAQEEESRIKALDPIELLDSILKFFVRLIGSITRAVTGAGRDAAVAGERTYEEDAQLAPPGRDLDATAEALLPSKGVWNPWLVVLYLLATLAFARSLVVKSAIQDKTLRALIGIGAFVGLWIGYAAVKSTTFSVGVSLALIFLAAFMSSAAVQKGAGNSAEKVKNYFRGMSIGRMIIFIVILVVVIVLVRNYGQKHGLWSKGQDAATEIFYEGVNAYAERELEILRAGTLEEQKAAWNRLYCRIIKRSYSTIPKNNIIRVKVQRELERFLRAHGESAVSTKC